MHVRAGIRILWRFWTLGIVAGPHTIFAVTLNFWIMPNTFTLFVAKEAGLGRSGAPGSIYGWDLPLEAPLEIRLECVRDEVPPCRWRPLRIHNNLLGGE